MIKIKVLLGFAICYVVFNIIHLSSQVIHFRSWRTIYQSILDSGNSFFGKSIWLIQNMISFVTLIGIIYVCVALFKIIKSGYFNIQASRSFKIGGLLLCFVAALDLIRAILEISASYQTEFQIGYLMVNGLLFLMGFGILIISKIIKNGTLLKQESDLTI
ncbi:DUF2975 domain-containing protein [Flavivirga aquimarina]|uniref:DUF2975 domain-containing protein n=1 Tax=Flavivirga aquimarina TaxID=2027862 RepID=A0ABT8WEF9_9FLAO|nr:DUF2975 domain-containing protein [Flavivirga aquimarina]MDO5971549.1 DUF2975 domain-containing protein [Flavivirga aquimarina]